MIQAEAGHQSTTPHPHLLFSGLRPHVSQLTRVSDVSHGPNHPSPLEWTPPSYFVPLHILSLVGPTLCNLYPRLLCQWNPNLGTQAVLSLSLPHWQEIWYKRPADCLETWVQGRCHIIERLAQSPALTGVSSLKTFVWGPSLSGGLFKWELRWLWSSAVLPIHQEGMGETGSEDAGRAALASSTPHISCCPFLPLSRGLPGSFA